MSEDEISWGKEWVITTVKKKVELGTDVRWGKEGQDDKDYNFELQIVKDERIQPIKIPKEDLEDFKGDAPKRRNFERRITKLVNSQKWLMVGAGLP